MTIVFGVRVSSAAAAVICAFLLAAGGSPTARGATENVRVRVAPGSVTVGQSVVVAATVRPINARCGSSLSHGSSTIRLATKRAAAGIVTWRAFIPATADAGMWTARVTCARVGFATAPFEVKAAAPATIPAKVVVVKSGISGRVSSIGSVFAGYGVVLQNVSPDEDALDVDVNVNVLDAGGRILKSESDRYAAIPAGATYYAGGETIYDGSTLPTRLEVSLQIGQHQKKSIAILPPVANVHVGEGFGGADVLGEFSNPYATPLSSLARVTAVCFDAAGNVIGGGSGYPESSVPPGGRIGLDVDIEGLAASSIASAQVSVEPETD